MEIKNIVRDLLGLEDIVPRTLDRVLAFGKGRAMLAGPWSGAVDGLEMYVAARRTVEDGANLNPKYWGVPWSVTLDEDRDD